MEFPISNSQLRNIADEFESYYEEKQIDDVVDMIIAKIVAIAYNQSQKTHKRGVNYGQPPRSTYDTVMDKKLSIKIISLQAPQQPFHKRGVDAIISRLYWRTDFKPLLPNIISKVQQAFPEMKITVDPLETYILFDWS